MYISAAKLFFNSSEFFISILFLYHFELIQESQRVHMVSYLTDTVSACAGRPQFLPPIEQIDLASPLHYRQWRVASMWFSFLSCIYLTYLLNELITSKCLEPHHVQYQEVIELKNVFFYYEHGMQKPESIMSFLQDKNFVLQEGVTDTTDSSWRIISYTAWHSSRRLYLIYLVNIYKDFNSVSADIQIPF